MEPALEKINISISAKNIIGIVGPSGAGKSTLIDIYLAFPVIPQQGNLKVDDSIITSENNRLWQNSIGYVAQSIFLSEGTILQMLHLVFLKSMLILIKLNLLSSSHV